MFFNDKNALTKSLMKSNNADNEELDPLDELLMLIDEEEKMAEAQQQAKLSEKS